MPALEAKLSLDSSQYVKGLSLAQRKALEAGSVMKAALITKATSPAANPYGLSNARKMGEAEGAEYARWWGKSVVTQSEKEKAYRARKLAIMGSGIGPGMSGYGFRGFDERTVAAQQGLVPGSPGYLGPRRARAWGGASAAMFVSVARDTAASLASGANPITVFMQQMPQVMQAFVMMGKNGFIALKDAMVDSLGKVVGMFGGKAGTAAAAGGAVALGATVWEGFKTARALLAEAGTERTQSASLYTQTKALRAYIEQLQDEGKISQSRATRLLNQTWSADFEGLADVRRQLRGAKFTDEDQAKFQKMADTVRQFAIEAESSPERRGRMMAEFERDRDLREARQISEKSGIPLADIEQLIQRRFDNAITAAESNNMNQRRQMNLNALQQVGGYAADPGTRMMQDDIRAIRRTTERFAQNAGDGVTY